VTRTEWEQVWSAYQASADLQPAERAAFIERTLADASLRERVWELLSELDGGDTDEVAPARDDNTSASWHFLGQSLGRFELVAPIGSGGMGEVYRALDTDLHRNVAIKCIAGHRLGSPDAVSKFIREARMASALNHPGIITVYEVIRTADTVAIAMELAEGETLRKVCGTPQPAAKVIRWGRQIAEALAASHAAGLVHRDIKPENLMLRPDGVIKVLDFGLARRHAEIEEHRDDGIAGTLRYMSPEQALGAELSPATDVFSLGIVLYELTGGKHPFADASGRGNSTMTVAQAIASSAAAPRLSEVAPRIPAALDSLVAAMLSADPAARPSAQEVAMQLEVIERPPTRWWMWAAAALVPFLCLSIWLVSRPGAPKPVHLATTPFTALQGAESQPAFSPDGSQIAFVWNGDDEGVKHIYIKPIGEDKVRQLTFGNVDHLAPVWSPDGSQIAFLQSGPGNPNADVMVVKTAGGELRNLGQCRNPENASRPLAWDPSGKFLLTRKYYKRQLVFWRVSVETGESTPLYKASVRHGDEGATFSPDGSAFASVKREGAHYSVCLGPPEGATTGCVPTTSKVSGLAWGPDARSILYADLDGLWRVPVDGGRLGRATRIAEGQFAGLAGDSRGRRFAYSRIYSDLNIWRIRIDGGHPERLIASSGEDREPAYSPDGKQILFASNRHGPVELFLADADGSNVRQLSSLNGEAGSGAWSPDGRSVAFEGATPQTRFFNIYVVPAVGGMPRRLTDDSHVSLMPSWSRDGRWIYYSRGTLSTAKIQVSSGEEQQVLTLPGIDLQESADAKEVLFMYRMVKPGIWRQNIDTGEKVLLSGTEDAHYRGWALASNGIYFTRDGERPALYFRDERSDAVRRIATLPGHLAFGPRTFALSPDGQWLLYTSEDLAIADIMLMEIE
jgi:Tol biopolymer transport system component